MIQVSSMPYEPFLYEPAELVKNYIAALLAYILFWSSAQTEFLKKYRKKYMYNFVHVFFNLTVCALYAFILLMYFLTLLNIQWGKPAHRVLTPLPLSFRRSEAGRIHKNK